MTLTGRIHNGVVELDEPVAGLDGKRVRIVVIDDDDRVDAALTGACTDDRGPTEVEREAIEELRSGRAKLVPHDVVRAKNAARR
jgi:hypothetical protein